MYARDQNNLSTWYTLRGTIKHLKTSTLLCIISFITGIVAIFFLMYCLFLVGQILVVLYPFFVKFHPFIVFYDVLNSQNNDLSKFCVNERNVKTFFLVSDRLNCLYYRISFYLSSLFMFSTVYIYVAV